MVQSPSWKANWFAASQEIPHISRYPKVHYRTHKRPPPVCILGQPNPVHIPTSHLLVIHSNSIHPSTPRSPQWSLSLRFPHQNPIRPPLLTHTRPMPNPSHSSRFYHPHCYSLQTQYMLPHHHHINHTPMYFNGVFLTIVTLASTNYCAPWWWCNCNTETCRSCFNVNFNIVFWRQHTSASIGQ